MGISLGVEAAVTVPPDAINELFKKRVVGCVFTGKNFPYREPNSLVVDLAQTRAVLCKWVAVLLSELAPGTGPPS